MAPVLARQLLRASQCTSFFSPAPARSCPRCVRVFSKAPEHDTGEQAPKEISPEFQAEIEAYKANEGSAARLTPAEELRTLVANESYGTVCTISSSGPTEGYAAGALTPFAVDEQGRVVCCLSSLSSHKRDLQKNGKASMVIAQSGFSNMTESRCTLTGEFKQVPEDQKVDCRELYLAKHPEAFWVDFGDFDYMRMDTVVQCNLIAGFGRATKVSAEEYLAAQPDPVAKFSKPVCGHMNEDHASATAAIIKHFAGITVESAKMLSIDRLGMSTRAVPTQAPEQSVNVRIAFTTPAEDRKAVKDRIVELTKSAAAAQKQAPKEAVTGASS